MSNPSKLRLAILIIVGIYTQRHLAYDFSRLVARPRSHKRPGANIPVQPGQSVTVQEGTATREDIDIGMKLGTNYPKGPFEWLNEIGIENVYKVLEAIYQDTKEERYKICPLLKEEYLLGR